MSKQLESKTCQFCHGILFEEDDVVVCPDCGAPYHRECFEKIGKCVYTDVHGTDKQYDALQSAKSSPDTKTEKTEKSAADTICSSCGRASSSEHKFCPYCGNEKASRQNGFTPFTAVKFDVMGGVDKSAIVEDDVTAGEAATFVGMKAYRYVPKFIANKKTSWNWAAFLVPQGWFAYRKMYGLMAITLAAFLLSIILMVPFYSELYAALSELPVANTNAEQTALMQQAVTLAMQNAEPSTLLLFMLGSLVDFGTMILSGLFGERAYRTRTLAEIKKIKQNETPEDPAARIAQKGGVNMFLCLIILVVVSNSDFILNLLISLF